MPSGIPLKVEQVAPILEEMKGNITATAKRLGVTRKAVHAKINESTTLQEILKDARAEMCDHAESALYASVVDKQGWAVCFTLKTLGKDRGYVERQELTGKDGADLSFTLKINNADSEQEN